MLFCCTALGVESCCTPLGVESYIGTALGVESYTTAALSVESYITAALGVEILYYCIILMYGLCWMLSCNICPWGGGLVGL